MNFEETDAARSATDRAEKSSAKVRVMIVAPAPLGEARIGGIANFIRGFIHYMPADFEVEILGVAVGNDTPQAKWHTITLAGREVSFFPVARSATSRTSGRIPMKMRAVGGMLRTGRHIDTTGRVVQIHSPAMDVGLLGRRAPIIRVVHNDPRDLARAKGESQWRRAGWSLHVFEKWTFRRAARVFFVNRATYESYAGKADPVDSRFSFLPNFVDTDVFRPLDESARLETRTQLAAELGVPADDRWVLFAGRLDHQKNPALAVRAFAATVRAGTAKPARLIVAGEGTLRAEAESLARELAIADCVRFVGNLPHRKLATLMPAADAFLLTSAFEAGPTVVYEALASGLPVVSTGVGEVPTLVAQGVTGWIAADQTPESLADGLRWALAQEYADVSVVAAQSIAAFHLPRVLAPFYDAHRELSRQ